MSDDCSKCARAFRDAVYADHAVFAVAIIGCAVAVNPLCAVLAATGLQIYLALAASIYKNCLEDCDPASPLILGKV